MGERVIWRGNFPKLATFKEGWKLWILGHCWVAFGPYWPGLRIGGIALLFKIS